MTLLNQLSYETEYLKTIKLVLGNVGHIFYLFRGLILQQGVYLKMTITVEVQIRMRLIWKKWIKLDLSHYKVTQVSLPIY